MKTNELKKGDWVLLRCGWRAEIYDNMRGNTRMAKVYGLYTEIGSIYSHDIAMYLSGSAPDRPEGPQKIELTKSQVKLMEMVEGVGI